MTTLPSQSSFIEWSEQAPGMLCRGVVLVVHGLNLKASRMDSLVGVLGDSGFKVGNMTLAGHSGQKVEASRRAWLENYQAAVAEIHLIIASHSNLPCYAVCMSLGALTFVDYITEYPDHPFQKALMLAPALSLRWYSHIFRVLSGWLPYVPIPSFSRPKDRVYGTLPLYFYAALYQTQDKVFRKLAAESLALPSIIVMDPRDELVSYSGIQSMIASGMLASASLDAIYLPPEAQGAHHLLVCPESMGIKMWTYLNQRLNDFFRD